MKKLFGLFISALILASCKKETSEMPIDTISQGYYNTPAHGHLSIQAGSYPYKLVVHTEGNSGISCSVESPVPITPGTYSELAPAGSAKSGISTWQYAGRSGPLIYSSFGSLTNPATVTITAITETTVTGSFKGTLRNLYGSSSDTLRVEGKFYVRFKRSIYFGTF